MQYIKFVLLKQSKINPYKNNCKWNCK